MASALATTAWLCPSSIDAPPQRSPSTRPITACPLSCVAQRSDKLDMMHLDKRPRGRRRARPQREICNAKRETLNEHDRCQDRHQLRCRRVFVSGATSAEGDMAAWTLSGVSLTLKLTSLPLASVTAKYTVVPLAARWRGSGMRSHRLGPSRKPISQ
jgi:hypothetical protein